MILPFHLPRVKSLEVRAIFLDISKAFDKVWHGGLIFKMRQNGISGQLLKLFQNYLNNRKQGVVLNGFPADYSTIESGVPHGSFLGWDGRRYLTAVGAGAFFRFTKLKTTCLLPTSKINYLPTADLFISLITLIHFMKLDVSPPDT